MLKKWVGRWGSTLDNTADGAYSTPPDPVAGFDSFEGATLQQERERRGGVGREADKERREKGCEEDWGSWEEKGMCG